MENSLVQGIDDPHHIASAKTRVTLNKIDQLSHFDWFVELETREFSVHVRQHKASSPLIIHQLFYKVGEVLQNIRRE
jgi:hypothetical protein